MADKPKNPQSQSAPPDREKLANADPTLALTDVLKEVVGRLQRQPAFELSAKAQGAVNIYKVIKEKLMTPTIAEEVPTDQKWKLPALNPRTPPPS